MLENYTNRRWRLDASEKFGEDINFHYLEMVVKNVTGHNLENIMNSIRLHAGIALLVQNNGYIKNLWKPTGFSCADYCRTVFIKSIGFRPTDFINAVANKDWKTLRAAQKTALLTEEEIAEGQPPEPQIDCPAFLQSCDLPLQWDEQSKRYQYQLPGVQIKEGMLPEDIHEQQVQNLSQLVECIAYPPILGGGRFRLFNPALISSFSKRPKRIPFTLQVLRYGIENFHDKSLQNKSRIIESSGVKTISRASEADAHYLFSIRGVHMMICIRMHAAMVLLQQGWIPSDVAVYTGINSHSHFTDCFKKYFGTTPENIQQFTPISPANMPEEWGCEMIDGQPEYFLKSGAAA